MIYYWDKHNDGPVKKCILWEELEKIVFIFQDMHSFFEFLFSVIIHYHINGMRIFWDRLNDFVSK